MASLSPLQEQKRQFTRTRLLDAAREVFIERGYSASTVDHIAAAAGASRATFYLHFDNKRTIAAELLSSFHTITVDRYHLLDEILTSTDGAERERLYNWLEGWLALWRDNAGLYHAMLTAQMTDRDLEAAAVSASGTFIDALDQYFAQQPEAARARIRARAVVLEQMTRTAFALATRGVLPVDTEVMLDFVSETWATVFLAED